VTSQTIILIGFDSDRLFCYPGTYRQALPFMLSPAAGRSFPIPRMRYPLCSDTSVRHAPGRFAMAGMRAIGYS
jgi:hypothetical protein